MRTAGQTALPAGTDREAVGGMHLVFMYFHFISGDTEPERSLPFACSRPHSPTAEAGPDQAGLGASRSPRGGAGGILVLESSLAAPRCSSAGTGVRVQQDLGGPGAALGIRRPQRGLPAVPTPPLGAAPGAPQQFSDFGIPGPC